MTAILEIIGYRAPLALRAIDSATGAEVGDGLVALAWPEGDPATARAARRSRLSTLLGFGALPGLRGQEFATGAGGAAPAWPALDPHRFIVTITDTFGRFLPQVLAVEAPQTAPLDVTLYSAPARPRPPGWATVYGEVLVSSDGTPAAWAVVELSGAGANHQTVSDESGRFLFSLPYPEALPVLTGSPPVGEGIGQISWTLTVTVHHEPASLSWPLDTAAGPPEIASIQAQTQAQITVGTDAQASIAATLNFGVPLLLRLRVVPV